MNYLNRAGELDTCGLHCLKSLTALDEILTKRRFLQIEFYGKIQLISSCHLIHLLIKFFYSLPSILFMKLRAEPLLMRNH